MIKRTIGKGVNFKKILAGAALAACLSPSQVALASDSSQKEKAPLSIILGARKGVGSNGLYGAKLGMKVGKIGFGVNGDLYSDINLQDTKENVFGDVYFQGREDLEKISCIGAFAEYYPRISERVSIVLGAGGGFKKGTRNIEENLLRGETVLASNTTTTSEKEVVGKVYSGLNFDLTKFLSINSVIGYEKSFKKNGLNGGGVYVGLDAILSFTGRGNKK